MPKRKSFAEELSELSNPAPAKEIDPEADLFGSGPVLEDSDDQLLQPKRSRGKERDRLRADIALEGIEYSGKRSTRKDFFGDEVAEEAEEEFGGDVAGQEDEEDEGESSSDGEEREGQDTHINGVHADQVEDGDDEAAALEREYRSLQHEEADAMAGLQERAAKERKKAIAVRAQRSLWNAGLELRIILQRALQGSNKMPQAASHRVAVSRDKVIQAGLEGLVDDARGTLNDFIDLLYAMETQNPAVKQAQEAAGLALPEASDSIAAVTSVDSLWAKLDSAYHRFAPFRDASIDRWHRKTVLTTGGAARGNLKVLNQSISSQVALLLRDSDRVVQRARLAKRQRTVLCEIEDERAPTIDDQAEGKLLIPGQTPDEDLDPETYDDNDFYQTLLKEFLEEKQDNAGVTWYTGMKQRKLVDRRASKGRKLRYHIHEKLVNFMTPVELEAPVYATNVFANLFGGATRKSS